MTLTVKDKTIDLSSPIAMGILNVTPNSFYSGNRNNTDKEILDCVEKILYNGGSIVDVGGYSTQPSAPVVSQEEELRRVSNAIEIIIKKFPKAILSIDTFRSEVAHHVVSNYGVAIVNDISGGTLDNQMFNIIAQLDVVYVLTHTRGTPQTMQTLTNYIDVFQEVYNSIESDIKKLKTLGVNNIVIDPGFGFAKTLEQNYTLLKKLNLFEELNVPILVGLSRKSMLYKKLGIEATESLNATTSANMLALVGGASILRVHDVKEAVEAIEIFKQYKLN